jgi:hypothetical protein
MRSINAGRALVVRSIAFLLFASLAGASMLSLAAPDVAEAQTEPNTAANGVVLPPLDYDPVAARDADLAGSVVPATPASPVDSADASAGTDTPEAVTAAPETGTSTTTSLGGSDVAVSSVGGSYEVDRPNKRSRK